MKLIIYARMTAIVLVAILENFLETKAVMME